MPRRSFSRPRRGPRRKLVWARTTNALTVTAGIAPALTAPARIDPLQSFEDSLGASLVGSTVVRTRGVMCAFNQDIEVGNEGSLFNVRAAAYIGYNNEVQRGPNANDNAFDELSEGKDYFLFEPFTIQNQADNLQTNGTAQYSRMIDVKSSRKIEELNQTIVFDVSASTPASVAEENLGFILDLSFLLMLP